MYSYEIFELKKNEELVLGLFLPGSWGWGCAKGS